MDHQKPKNDPFALTYKPRWWNYQNFSWSKSQNLEGPSTMECFLEITLSNPTKATKERLCSLLPSPPVFHTQSHPSYNENNDILNNPEKSHNSLEKVMRTMEEQLFLLVTANREKGTFPSHPKSNPNVGPCSMRLPIQDNVKKVNVITSMSSSCLIDHNLNDLMGVPINSPSLSPPAFI